MKYKNVGLQEQERKTIYFPEVCARDFRTKTQAFHMWLRENKIWKTWVSNAVEKNY